MPCVGVLFTGTGSALHPSRMQSSLVLDTPAGLIAVDMGCGALNIMAARGLDPASLEVVILTHAHYDHLCGLPHLAFLRTFKGGGRLYLAGEPEAVETGLRIASAVKGGPGRVELSPRGLEQARRMGLTVRLGQARHSVPAVSVSLDYSGVRIVVSGDTEPTQWFRLEAEGAALAVHEATMPSGEEARARATGHSTVAEAVEQVSPADLGALYHLSQQSERDAIKTAPAGGRVIVPNDGLYIKVC